MSTPASLDYQPGRIAAPPGAAFACAALAVALGAALLSGWAPLRFSIVTVFLSAGPHNWLEFRYFLTRLPARWGRLRNFFLTAFGGMFGLTGSYVLLTYLHSTRIVDYDLADVLYPT